MATDLIAAPFLTGARIYLRALMDADCAGPYLEWFNDPEVCRLNGHHRFPYRHEDARAFVQRVNASREELVLAIVRSDDHRHIGNVALQQIDFVSRSAELAIVIGARDCWGQGYSKEAGRLLLEHAFFSLNLNRVYCGTLEHNVPMQRLAVHLGMREEGRRRHAVYKADRYLDVIEYGVLKGEYAERGSARGISR
jgi:RimJ/RimL family protein N-acetyltransferase